MEAYSKEFRRDVLAACDAGGGTCAVALRFDVSESWVRRIKQDRREQDKTAPQTTRNRRKIWEPYTAWILAKLDQRPDIYLRELQAVAIEELDWEVSDVPIKKLLRLDSGDRNPKTGDAVKEMRKISPTIDTQGTTCKYYGNFNLDRFQAQPNWKI